MLKEKTVLLENKTEKWYIDIRKYTPAEDERR